MESLTSERHYQNTGSQLGGEMALQFGVACDMHYKMKTRINISE
jgi:hypothetical protein